MRKAIAKLLRGTLQTCFEASLTRSIVPEKSINPAVSFSRTTTAMVVDNEGILRTALAGEARFGGARRVENLISATGDYTNAAWLAFGGATKGAQTVTFVDNVVSGISQFGKTVKVGDKLVVRVTVQNPSGSSVNMTLNLYNGQGSTLSNVTKALPAGSTTKLSLIGTVTVAGASAGVGLSVNQVGAVTLGITEFQLQNKTGSSAVSKPDDFVSKGVLPAPYHGAGVDGVKYFATANANSVSSNVLTEVDGATLTGMLGFLREGASTNLVIQSADLTNVAWTTTDSTVAANAPAAPDGTASAALVTCGSANTADLVQASPLTITANAFYCFSVYLKTGAGVTWVLIRYYGGGGTLGCYFNLSTGEIGSQYAAGTATGYVANIEPAAKGFYRVSVSGVVDPNSTSPNISIIPVTADGDTTRPTGGVYYIWNPQVEAGPIATSPILTTTAAATRNADALSIPYGNLDPTKGTLFASYYLPSHKGITNMPSARQIVGWTGNLSLAYHSSSQLMTTTSAYDGTSETMVGTSRDASLYHTKINSKWSGGAVAIRRGSSAANPYLGSYTLGSFNVSSQANTNPEIGGPSHLYGYIRDVKISKKIMKDSWAENL
jgi:hypothetical protein